MSGRASFASHLLLLLLAIGGLAWSVDLADRESHRRVGLRLEADLAVVAAAARSGNVPLALTLLETQARTTDDPFLYKMTDPETRRPLSVRMPGGHGWREADDRAMRRDAHRLLARSVLLDGHYPLLIARPVPTIRDMVAPLWLVLGGVALLILSGELVLLWRRWRRDQDRLTHVEAVLGAFRDGDHAARTGYDTDDDDSDAIARIARHIDRNLDSLAGQFTGFRLMAERFAHELRGPVALSVNRMREAQARATTDSATVTACIVAAERLLTVFDSVLFFAALGQREPQAHPMPLHSAAYDIAMLYQPAAEARGITILCDLVPTVIVAEAPLIERLIVNLVANAVKFTAPDSVIDIRVATAPDGRALLTVRDEGPGMAGMPADPGQYLRRGPAGDGVAGVGLGLNAVQHIAEFHRATVHYADRPDRTGLCVTVTFPADAIPGSE